MPTDPYWTTRHALYVQHEKEDGAGLEEMKEAIKNYATAWGIFAALLMTVSFSLIPVDTGAYYDDNTDSENAVLSYVYVLLLVLSTICSFLAVLVGTFRYNYFDGVPAAMITVALKASKLPGSQLFVYPAMLTQLLASVVSCYLFLGSGVFVMALLVGIVFCGGGFVYVLHKYQQSVAGIMGLSTPSNYFKSKRDVTDPNEKEAMNTDVVEENDQ